MGTERIEQGPRNSFKMSGQKVQKIMTQPINLIFRFLQNKARIQIMLYENTDMRIEGRIIGFDEYMNLVLDDAEEISRKKESRKALGRILLKGGNILIYHVLFQESRSLQKMSSMGLWYIMPTAI